MILCGKLILFIRKDTYKLNKKILILFFLLVCFLYIILNKKQNVSNKILGSEDIMAISQIWSYAKEYYPNWESKNEKEWDELYKNILQNVNTNFSYYNYYCDLEKMCAFLEDGHATIIPNTQIKEKIGVLPYKFDYIEGSYYITERERKSKLPLFSKLIEINGEPIKDYLEKNIQPLLSNKTENANQFEAIKRFICDELGTKIELKVENINKQYINEIVTYNIPYNDYGTEIFESMEYFYNHTFLYNSNTFQLYELDGSTVHIIIKTFMGDGFMNEFDEYIAPLIRNKNVIIDVRNNNGGNSSNGMSLLSRISNSSLPTLKSYYQISDARLKAFASCDLTDDYDINKGQSMLNREYLTYDNDELKIQNKKIDILNCVILISHKSGSAVDDFAYCAKQMDIPLIGTNTRGATGQIAYLPLNNNCYFILSACNTLGEDNEKISGVGIDPTFLVNQTMDDMINKKDTVFNYAYELITN